MHEVAADDVGDGRGWIGLGLLDCGASPPLQSSAGYPYRSFIIENSNPSRDTLSRALRAPGSHPLLPGLGRRVQGIPFASRHYCRRNSHRVLAFSGSAFLR